MPTGRIGRRQQLAGGALLVSWGCSGGVQRVCGDHIHIIEFGSIFPVCMWKWGGFAPHGQARLWQPKGASFGKSQAVWQSCASRAEKLRTFTQTHARARAHTLDPFLGLTGVLFAVCALLTIF